MDQVYIGTTSYGAHWLDRPAAESWFRMVRDGCPAGGITDAGRTHAEQVTVFLKYFTTDYASSAKHDRRVWEGRTYWRRPGRPSAATPGSVYARHVSGRALDLNGATKSWVRANGHRYGWIKDLVAGEDWHMEYQANRDVALVSNPGASTGGSLPTVDVTAPAPIEENDMDATQAQQLAEIHARLFTIDQSHDWLKQITPQVGEVHDRIGTIDQTRDWVREIHGGVAGIEQAVRTGGLGAVLERLSDEDVRRIAQASADEAARRLQQ